MAETANLKIAILSNITLDLLAPSLEEELDELGLSTSFYIAGYNQYTQEILDPNSLYYAFKPNITILFIDAEELYKDILSSPFEFNNEEKRELINDRSDEIIKLADKAQQTLPQNVMLLNTIISPPLTITGALDYNSEFSIKELFHLYNQKLSDFSRNAPNIFLVNYASLVTHYGYKNLTDDRLKYLARMTFDKKGLQHLAHFYAGYIRTIKGLIKKCIIVDLDNTLWGGIIGEDGIEGIILGEDGTGRAYRDFQRELLNLTHKGIILAIASKNNYDDIKELFEKHPFMLLKEKDFVTARINWKDKVTNINEIVQELNIGPDTIVFIDDNPVERMLVRKELPAILTPDMPTDPCYLRSWILELSNTLFSKIAITEEDRKRTQIYTAQTKRSRLRKTSNSLDDFYRSLNMKAIIKTNDTTMTPRIAQLTHRTNQFNLTTKRYSEADIKHFMSDPSHRVYSVELIDKFGSNGIIGVLILQKQSQSQWRADAFLLSCRVIGRTLEYAFLWYVIEELKKLNCKSVLGEYLPTEKNMLVKDLYFKLGFKRTSGTVNKTLWKFEIDKNKIKKPEWIEITAE